MKEIMAENYTSESFQEEETDRLSFCDLPIQQNNSGSTHPSPRPSSAQPDHLFEFFVSKPESTVNYSNVVFCRKFILKEEVEDQLNEYQKRDYFATTKSQSFRKPSFEVAKNPRFSASTRFSGDLEVNITSLTSMSAKSRRRMFMFGPVKFKPEMELSAIKQRQGKRPPAETTLPSGGEKSQWALVKLSLRGRSYLTSLLARSLGCIPVVRGGMGRWVSVAN